MIDVAKGDTAPSPEGVWRLPRIGYYRFVPVIGDLSRQQGSFNWSR
jgi:hypothetical protein